MEYPKSKLIGNRQPKNSYRSKGEKENAAVKIQAAFRGYYTRKEIEKSKDNNEPIIQKRYIHIQNKNENFKDDDDEVDFTDRSQFNDSKVRRDEKKSQYKIKSNEQKPEQKNIQKLSKIPTNKDNSKKSNLQENEYLNEKAAITIQASFRGYKARQTLQKKSNKFQNKPIPHQKDKKVKSQSGSYEKLDEHKDWNKAATTIQAGFRGYKARQNVKWKGSKTMSKSNDNINEDLEKAATKIQAGFRSYRVRKTMKDNFKNEATKANKINEEHAASQIQAGFRGYRARKEMKEKQIAAKTIQAGYRGYKSRKEKMERERAAEKIQAGYRSYKIRKDMESRNLEKPKNISPAEQTQQRNDAATKIQAAFRSYVVRRGTI